MAVALATLGLAAGLSLAPLIQSAPTATAATQGYVPLSPSRILDTRSGIGAPATTVGPDSSIDLHVLGRAGIPDTGVSAVAINVTAVDPTSPSYITVWPTGHPRPDASNLNVQAGTTIPNFVIAPIGNDGNISLYNERGNVHLLADIVGYFTAGNGITALTPTRILDTRSGIGAPATTVGPDSSIDLHVLGRAGIPDTGVSAVAINVTAVDPTSPSYITVWPTGHPRPDASNLNVQAGTTIPNFVIAPIGNDGNISLYNERGNVHLLADIVGYFTAGNGITALTPTRILDTRSGIGAPATTVGPDSSIDLHVLGRAGIPDTGVSAVAINVTAVDPTSPSYITVWPTGHPRPDASNLNVQAGTTIPNFVIAPIGNDGNISLYNERGNVHLLADIVGYFTGTPLAPPPSGGTPPAPPSFGTPPVVVPPGGSGPGAAALGTTSYPVPNGAVFVATNGNDGDPGTSASPLLTLNRALAITPPGGTIVMRSGRYRESVTITKQVTIQNAPGAVVWLDGSSPVSGWVASGNVWRKDGWTTRFDHSPTYVQGAPDYTQPFWQFLNPAFPMAAHPDQVWIDGVEQQQVASHAQVTAGTFYLDEASSQLYLGSNPSGRTVEASTVAKALSIRAPGVVIRGIGVRRYAPSVYMVAGITLEAPSAQVQNVIVEDMATNALSALAADITIDRVTIRGAGMLGLHARFADRLTVNAVQATNNNAERFNVTPNAGGAKIGQHARAARLQQRLLRQPCPRVLGRHVRLRLALRQQPLRRQRGHRAVPRDLGQGRRRRQPVHRQRRVRDQGQQHQRRQDLEQHLRRQRPAAEHRAGPAPQHEPLRPGGGSPPILARPDDAVDARTGDDRQQRDRRCPLECQLPAVRGGLQPAQHRRANGRHRQRQPVQPGIEQPADVARDLVARNHRQPLRVHDPGCVPGPDRSGVVGTRTDRGRRRRRRRSARRIGRRPGRGSRTPPPRRHRRPRRPTRRHPTVRHLELTTPSYSTAARR